MSDIERGAELLKEADSILKQSGRSAAATWYKNLSVEDRKAMQAHTRYMVALIQSVWQQLEMGVKESMVAVQEVQAWLDDFLGSDKPDVP